MGPERKHEPRCDDERGQQGRHAFQNRGQDAVGHKTTEHDGRLLALGELVHEVREAQLQAVGPGARAKALHEAHARGFVHRIEPQRLEEVLVRTDVVSLHEGLPAGGIVRAVVLRIALELVGDEVLVVLVLALQEQRGGEHLGGHGVFCIEGQRHSRGFLRLGIIPQTQVHAGDDGVAEIARGIEADGFLRLEERGFHRGGLSVLRVRIQREGEHAAGKGILRLQRDGAARGIHGLRGGVRALRPAQREHHEAGRVIAIDVERLFVAGDGVIDAVLLLQELPAGKGGMRRGMEFSGHGKRWRFSVSRGRGSAARRRRGRFDWSTSRSSSHSRTTRGWWAGGGPRP